MIGDFYPDLLEMEDNESPSVESTERMMESSSQVEEEEDKISVKETAQDEEMEAPVAPSSPTPEDLAYAKEAKEKIHAVLEEVEELKNDILALDEGRANLLKRLVIERLLRRSVSSADLNISLSAGVHRNKAGELVSKLFKAIEKLDAVLSFGNSEIASSRKQAVKVVESLLETADKKLNKAKNLVKFVERIVASPRAAAPPQRRKARAEKLSPALLPHERFLQRKRTSPSQPLNSSSDFAPAAQEPNLELETRSSPSTSPGLAKQRTSSTRNKHPVPRYEIVNNKRSVEIFLGLPRGFDVERELSLELRNSNVLQVLGFEEPLEFAIDPKTMDVRNITYKAMPSQGLLVITIPRVEPRPARRVIHPAYVAMPQTRRVVDPFWW